MIFEDLGGDKYFIDDKNIKYIRLRHSSYMSSYRQNFIIYFNNGKESLFNVSRDVAYKTMQEVEAKMRQRDIQDEGTIKIGPDVEFDKIMVVMHIDTGAIAEAVERGIRQGLRGVAKAETAATAVTAVENRHERSGYEK